MRLWQKLYSLVCYALFLAWFLYAIGFVGNFLVPKTIDAPAGAGGWTAFFFDAALLCTFAAQHSLMARPTFKRWWKKFVPEALERSTYVLFSSLIFFAAFAAWRPLPTLVWDLRGTAYAQLLLALYALGWLIVFLSSFMINHFELFGLAQVWRRPRERQEQESGFREVLFYRLVRHPLMSGFLVLFWAAPAMSEGRLIFALLMSAYILVGTRLEERDLLHDLGAAYRNYRMRVPMFFPVPGFKHRSAESTRQRSAGL